MLLSYGVLAFAAHPLPSVLILVATFYHPAVGLMGLTGNVFASLTARWFGANRDVWNAGIFGISGMLVGLAIGMHSEFTVRMMVFLIVGASAAGFLSVFLGSLFAKRDLPILSIAFMLVIWPLLLVIGRGSIHNELSTIPFLQLTNDWLHTHLRSELFTYINMFGTILFQENLLSGLLVIIAISLYSRISMAFTLVGGAIGILTYSFLHGSLDGFQGLNYVLTALAFGGYFVVPNRHGAILTVIAVVLVGMLDYSAGHFLNEIRYTGGRGLPTFVFAFNTITILFLYPLKVSALAQTQKRLIPVPLYVIKNPEANMHWYRRWIVQSSVQKTLLTLPFMGRWTVLQGNDGEWTHKDLGKYAWDFVVTGSDGKQFSGFGLKVEDFHSFGLPVLAPAPGTVYAVNSLIADNPPRSSNTEQNWGNYIIINHGNGEFSELSHFKQGSITVVPGQYVERGQIIGYCGNSGRSAAPHIHFQLQDSPELGARSLPVKFSEAMVNGKIQVNSVPDKDDGVATVSIEKEAEWTLLGKETETWKFDCRMGMARFTETLEFSTDLYGLPAILSKNHYLWYILDKPNFVEVIPDYKTFPSLLSPSGWMRAVGESMILPKRLRTGLTWDGGKVLNKEGDIWTVESTGRTITIDSTKERILKIEIPGHPSFRFESKP